MMFSSILFLCSEKESKSKRKILEVTTLLQMHSIFRQKIKLAMQNCLQIYLQRFQLTLEYILYNRYYIPICADFPEVFTQHSEIYCGEYGLLIF